MRLKSINCGVLIYNSVEGHKHLHRLNSSWGKFGPAFEEADEVFPYSSPNAPHSLCKNLWIFSRKQRLSVMSICYILWWADIGKWGAGVRLPLYQYQQTTVKCDISQHDWQSLLKTENLIYSKPGLEKQVGWPQFCLRYPIPSNTTTTSCWANFFPKCND